MVQNGVFVNLLLQETPPPLPKSRPYTVMGNMKMGFPQTRIMKFDYPGKLAVCFKSLCEMQEACCSSSFHFECRKHNHSSQSQVTQTIQ